jgi:hypothetical protein
MFNGKAKKVDFEIRYLQIPWDKNDVILAENIRFGCEGSMRVTKNKIKCTNILMIR